MTPETAAIFERIAVALEKIAAAPAASVKQKTTAKSDRQTHIERGTISDVGTSQSGKLAWARFHHDSRKFPLKIKASGDKIAALLSLASQDPMPCEITHAGEQTEQGKDGREYTFVWLEDIKPIQQERQPSSIKATPVGKTDPDEDIPF